jgi:hypothetical protein
MGMVEGRGGESGEGGAGSVEGETALSGLLMGVIGMDTIVIVGRVGERFILKAGVLLGRIARSGARRIYWSMGISGRWHSWLRKRRGNGRLVYISQ